MIYILGFVEYGNDTDGEYCFDILDCMSYILSDDDVMLERDNAIRVYLRKYNTMTRTPTFIAYIFDNVVCFDMDVLRCMFKPLEYKEFYRIAIGYHCDETSHIQYMNCKIGEMLISSDCPGCPPNMVGVPWDMFIQTLQLHPAVMECVPTTLLNCLHSSFTKKNSA